MHDEKFAIEFENVSKNFDDEKILNNVSFKIEKGRNYFLYGASSIGKTTILRIITREIMHDNGIVKIFGDELSVFSSYQIALYRREIGVIWQDLKLLPNRTVAENIAVPLFVKGVDESLIKEKVNEFLSKSNLLDVKNKYPEFLSHAVKQKVALLRALIGEPKIIVGDEVMAHIDTKAKDELWNILQNNKINNCSVVLTTSQKHVVDKFAHNSVHVINLDELNK
jgi:cell division transport system ATP-binding protein